jgi:glycosyltransferase involved in cell wall biosynthesis
MPHTISIVTPSFNQGKFIRQTVDSVLSQDYPTLEYWVIDGGSTDETLGILRSYQDERLQWVSEPDQGQTDAINKGLARSSGEILAYLNSDDIYLPHTLSFVADYFTNHPEADVVHGNCLAIDSEGHILSTMKGDAFDLRKALIKRWHVPQPAVFWRRRVMDSIGLLNASLHYILDYEYWLRMVIAGFRPQYVDRDLAGFRYHEESKTVSHYAAFMDEWDQFLTDLYNQPHLPPEVRQYQSLSFAYLAFHGADTFWQHGDWQGSRHYLHRILGNPSPFRLKVIAVAMLIDSYWGVDLFSGVLKKLYESTR